MKTLVVNRKIIGSILTTVLLSTLLALIGCGADEDDNSQPIIEPIEDKTVDEGDTTEVLVKITDADIDDTHTVRASSSDPNVATVSVSDTSLTITGVTPGTTTIQVSVTDDSAQSNAMSLPVTFALTVNDYIGLCTVGMILQPGESCGYSSGETNVVFSVLRDGSACREGGPTDTEILGVRTRINHAKFCNNWNIEQDDLFNTSFSAFKNPDGSWTVRSLPAPWEAWR